ncbi:probable ATP-dependent RNA helicase spindle-E [Phlebotomus argentipes]|uniref:probable ATP-dependent RNA helicase spindle-E n=1 Tax=Phlebotomus argentipes TaxID=94469 RepID=UPI0028930880|nr:probable ATP-dependent RNA helicase spindle-E [Phlebotomus argentipes]
MDLMDFFNPSKKTVRRPIIAGGRVNTHIEKEEESRPTPEDNYSYAEKHQEHEMRLMRHVKDEETFMNCDGDDDAEDGVQSEDESMAGAEGGAFGGRQNDDLYQRYNFETKITPRLPIAKHRTEIMKTLEQNDVVVIEGATGCGKTTQVPQYIMEDAFAKKKYFNIVVTQPRRLAALSVAKRVAQERQWELGEVVGYQIGRKRECSEDTRINYCTTGVLLEKVVKSQSLAEYTHIILDEVHERDINMDFLLIVLRKFFYRSASNVKIIMMSATIKSEKFASYFTVDKSIPVIDLHQASPYVVREYYIDDIKKLGFEGDIVSDTPDISPQMYTLAAKLVLACDKIEKREAQEAQEDENSPAKSDTSRSILMFLPGINEINQMHMELEKFSIQNQGLKCEIIPLHSSLTHEEQQRAFKNYPNSTRKVILSTNIAESSITVPDVKYVIDFCLTKSLRVDSATNFSTLQLEWASLDNCRQRSGRAGRVMDGRVYRMVTKSFYRNQLPKHITPEMQRQSLEIVVLKSKLIEMGPPETVLALAMDPPFKANVHNAILVLKELGALLDTVDGEFKVNDGDMTYLGKVMANLPVDIRVSRLIMLSYAFSVLEDAIIIGAAISVQGVFSESYKEQMKTYSSKLAWANGTGSDLIALLNVYKVYTERIRQNQRRYEDIWAKRSGVQIRMLREVVELVQELTYRLSFFNIQPIPVPFGVIMNDYERCIILKVAFAGAFYPNYAVYGNMDGDRERETFRLTNGRDPRNTVIMSGLPSKHVGQLYRKTIRDIFSSFVEHSTKIEVNFDHSERVYISFYPSRSIVDSQLASSVLDHNMDSDVSGNVLLEVYKAIKFGQIRRAHKINVLNAGNAEQYAVKHGAGELIVGDFHWKKNEEMRREYVVYPRKNNISGTITHIVHLHKFYVIPIEQVSYEEHIRTLLNTKANLQPILRDNMKVGMMVAAMRKFDESGYFCRGRILANDETTQHLTIFFIDFGNTDNVLLTGIRGIRPGIYINECPLEQLPPRTLECRLACIAPTAISSVRGRWTLETVKKFSSKIRIPSQVTMDVYAFLDGVAYVTLMYNQENMNEWAVVKKLAQYSDENYMAKFDHDRRMTCEKLKHEYILDDVQIEFMVKPEEVEIAAPPENICDKELSLRGPTSPLAALLFSLTKTASKKMCKIERNSVNCVLLDSDFQDYHQKMVVATHLNNTTSGNLCMYNTTLMPNIPGILPLMALIFCPKAEFFRNADNSRFISILTGLGTLPGSKVPMFEEHDLQIPLDVKIDHDDIECINQLRYSMSSLLLLRTGQDVPQLDNNVRYQLLHKIKELILSIVTRPRPLCEKKYPLKPYVWNQCDVKLTELLEVKDLHNGKSIFPFLTSLKLDPVADKQLKDRLRKACSELYDCATKNLVVKGVQCVLCDTYLHDTSQLRLHFLTKLHQDREREIDFVPQKSEI